MQNWNSTAGMTALPSHAFKCLLSHIGDMSVGVVVHHNISMLPIRSFLLNSCLESFHLLNIEFCVDHLVLFK